MDIENPLGLPLENRHDDVRKCGRGRAPLPDRMTVGFDRVEMFGDWPQTDSSR